MFRFGGSLSIRGKLTLMTMGVSMVSFLAVTLGFIVYDRAAFRASLLGKLGASAELIAATATAALQFQSAPDATEILSSLEEEADIRAAALYRADGGLLADYHREGDTTILPEAAPDISPPTVEGRDFAVTRAVDLSGRRVGFVHMLADATSLDERQRGYLWAELVLACTCLLVSFALAARLQTLITQPIYRLVDTMRKIGAGGEYNLRAEKSSADELGLLVDGFNGMLDQIEARDAELGRTLAEIKALNARLERTNRELTDFAYASSHDLKAPLRAIQNLAEWVTEDCGKLLPDASRDHLNQLQQRAKRLGRLLDELLAFARIGHEKVAPVPVDLFALCEEIVEMIGPRPGIKVEIDPDMPRIMAAAAPLRQALHNLISNAIHHHEGETGHVRVSARREGKMVKITIADDGPGIDPRHHQRIFQIFQSLKPAEDGQTTGMGLAIVKKVAEAEGGAITLESALGQGSRFHLAWPAG